MKTYYLLKCVEVHFILFRSSVGFYSTVDEQEHWLGMRRASLSMPSCHVSRFTVWWLCHNYYFPLRDMNFWMQDLVIVKYHETCKLNVCSLLGHALVLASFCDHPVEYVNWVLDETNRWIKQVMLQNVLQVCSLYSTMLLDAFIYSASRCTLN